MAMRRCARGVADTVKTAYSSAPIGNNESRNQLVYDYYTLQTATLKCMLVLYWFAVFTEDDETIEIMDSALYFMYTIKYSVAAVVFVILCLALRFSAANHPKSILLVKLGAILLAVVPFTWVSIDYLSYVKAWLGGNLADNIREAQTFQDKLALCYPSPVKAAVKAFMYAAGFALGVYRAAQAGGTLRRLGIDTSIIYRVENDSHLGDMFSGGLFALALFMSAQALSYYHHAIPFYMALIGILPPVVRYLTGRDLYSRALNVVLLIVALAVLNKFVPEPFMNMIWWAIGVGTEILSKGYFFVTLPMTVITCNVYRLGFVYAHVEATKRVQAVEMADALV